MRIETIILIAIVPLILALLAIRYYGWHDYVKNRKYRGDKLKKFADKTKEKINP